MSHTSGPIEINERLHCTCPECNELFRLSSIHRIEKEFETTLEQGRGDYPMNKHFVTPDNTKIALILPLQPIAQDSCVCTKCGFLFAITWKNISYQ